MLQDLYAPLPDTAAYLRRIGLAPDAWDRRVHPELPPSPTHYSVPHTKAALDSLIAAHLHHVPFENLDVYDLGREVSLEIPALFEKVVVRRRGGYCFELNALFFALLESLGFRGYPIAQRVLCDVGYGGPSPVSTLYLDSGAEQVSGKNRFRLDRDPRRGLRRLNLLEGDRTVPLLLFSEAPLDAVDFLPLNSYMACNENSCFRRHRVMNLLLPEGSVSVVDDRLRIHRNGRLEERPIASRAELKAVCTAYFGIPEASLAAL